MRINRPVKLIESDPARARRLVEAFDDGVGTAALAVRFNIRQTSVNRIVQRLKTKWRRGRAA